MRHRLVTRALAVLATGAALLVAGPSASGAPAPLHLTAAGDFGNSDAARSVLAGMGTAGADLALALGDLSYGVTGQEQAWCDLVTGAVGPGSPFELLAGNHESNGLNGNINDFAACLPNQLPGVVGTYGRQYYVDVPKAAPVARLVMVSPGLTYPDSTWSYAPGTPRHAWTTAAIDGARAAGIPWVVVGMHKPCLSVGLYTCESGAELMDTLLAERVDLVLSGHEHAYGRTRQLGHAAGCPSLVPGRYVAACVADPDDEMVKGAGTVFATVGTGGIPLRDVDPADPERPYFARISGRNADPAAGYLDITADAGALTGRFVATRGTFTDSFTVRAGAAQPAPVPLARDAFARTLTGSWGSSDRGGAWTLTGPAAAFGVGGGVGRMVVATPGTGVAAKLSGTTTADADVQVTTAVDRVPTGSGSYVDVVARRVTGAGGYRSTVRVLPDGSVTVALLRLGANGTVVATLQPETAVPGLRAAPGERLRVRTQATGTSPTNVRAKVWRAAAAEPAAWTASQVDGTAALQAPGHVALGSYVSSTATVEPVTFVFDDLVVAPTG